MRIAIIMKRYNKTSYSLPHVCRFGHGTVERLRINGTDLDFSLFRGKIYSDLMPRGRPHLMAQEGRKSR